MWWLFWLLLTLCLEISIDESSLTPILLLVGEGQGVGEDSSIDISKHNVNRRQDGDQVCHKMTFDDLGQHR